MHDALQDGDQTVLSLPLEVKADGEPGSFEGYGAVFGNTDRDGDVVERGAFEQSLKSRLPALLWQHNPKDPIGRFDVVREDAKGLYVKGRLSGSGRGAEAYELLKMGALNGLSIGFVTKEALRNRATGTRTIKRAELMEVSLVTFPANELARVNTVKASGPALPACGVKTPRDFERLLREHGFSRSRAKAITAKGFRRALSNGELGCGVDGGAIADVIRLIKRRRSQLVPEIKKFGRLEFVAGPTWNDRWRVLGVISPSAPTNFRVAARSLNPGRTKGAFLLRIKYNSRRGMRTDTWLSNGGSTGNGPYYVDEGMQEILVKGMSPAIPQRVEVKWG